MEFTINDEEFEIPAVNCLPTLESILSNRSQYEFDDVSFCSSTNFDSCTEYNYSEIQSEILNVTLKKTIFNSEYSNYGSLTVISCTNDQIIVGTSKGLLIAFTFEDEFLWKSHDVACCDQGGISAIAVNQFLKDKLLIGYERGNISLLNSDGSVILRLPDAHAPQSAVLILKFTDDPYLALCTDSTGSVFTINLTKRLNIWTGDSNCLFSGARGEVCTLEPLILLPNQHTIKPRVLIALVTFSKIIVLKIRPNLQVIYAFPLPKSNQLLLPVVCWQTFDSNVSSDAILVFGRGTDLFIHQIRINDDKQNQITWSQLHHFELSYQLISINWFATNRLVCMDTNEILHVFNCKNNKEIESIDLSHLQLVYACAHFKALATGGKVSEAFKLAGERACYNSFAVKQNVYLIVGINVIQKLVLRDYKSQCHYLSDLRKWKELFHYTLSDPNHITPIYSINLFINWLENVKDHELDKITLFSFVRFCIKVNKINYLSNHFWDLISKHKTYLAWFFDIIVLFIRDNEILTISPAIVHELLKHNENIKNFDQIEMLILNLDKSCLDLNLSMILCRKYDLYDAHLYLMSQAFNEFVEPLIELIPKLTKDNHRLGNSLLVYISYCFSSIGYPKGNIAEDQAERVKHDILRCLMTSRHYNNSSNWKYFYLRKLLMYHFQECLNVLKVGYGKIEFRGNLAKMQQHRLVDILLEIVKSSDFTQNDMVILAMYIAQLIISNNINNDETLIKYIVDILLNPKIDLSPRDHDEREQVLIDLYLNFMLDFVQNSQLINLALNNNCYKFAITLFEHTGQFENIINCYLLDNFKKNEVFQYLEMYSCDKTRQIEVQIRANFKQLLELDTKRLISIMDKYFEHFLQDDRFESFLLNLLEDCDELLLNVLQELFNVRKFAFGANLQEIFVELMCKHNDQKLMEFLEKCPKNDLRKFYKLTQYYKKFEASVYIHETFEEYHQALDILLNLIEVESSTKSYENENNSIKALVLKACGICSKSSNKDLWLKLLRSRDFEPNLLQTIIRSAIICVDLTTILDTLTSARYNDIKSLVDGVLSELAFQSLIINTTKKIQGKDSYMNLEKTMEESKKGYFFINYCTICRKDLLYGKTSVIFWCGHCFHADCLNTNLESDSLMCATCKQEAQFYPNIDPVPVIKHNNLLLRPDLENLF